MRGATPLREHAPSAESRTPVNSEGPEQVGGRVGLCLDARLYSLDEDGEKFLFFAPVQLDGARDELGVQYGLRRLPRSLRAPEHDRDGAGSFGSRVQPEVALGDHAERAKRAGEELTEVVTGHVLDYLAAGLRHRPVREYDRNADDEVPDRAVSMP